MQVYKSKPIAIKNGIPYFSEVDSYIQNYENISSDHLASVREGAGNPFMDEQYWEGLENQTIAHLQPYLFESAKILDVGVGLGRLLSKIDVDCEKYGVDISETYLTEAKEKGIEVCMAKIEELPYQDDLFDVIISTDVLEHVFDFYKCVGQILRVLKPGGILLIRVPYKEDLSHYVTYYKYDFVHVRNFDKPSLELLFTKMFNCSVLSFETMGYYQMPSKLLSPLYHHSSGIYKLINYFKVFTVNRVSKGDCNQFYRMLLENNVVKHSKWVRIYSTAFYYISRLLFAGPFREEQIYEKVEISIVVQKSPSAK